jgi:hypothetical protein
MGRRALRFVRKPGRARNEPYGSAIVWYALFHDADGLRQSASRRQRHTARLAYACASHDAYYGSS